MSQSEFIREFGSVYEHSPWMAEQLYKQKLISGKDDCQTLTQAFQKLFLQQSKDKQLEVTKAHPDLAGKLAIGEQLTEHSNTEQRSAGLDQCSVQEFQQFNDFNKAYKAKFNFPFIKAVKGQNRQTILCEFEQRLNNSHQQEFETALDEINKIAAFRLQDWFDHNHYYILKPQPLTRQSFKPYGQVIELDDHQDIKAINYGQTNRFHDLADLNLNKDDGQPLFSIFRSKPISFPFQIKVIERHPLSSQLFYPLSEQPFLVLVANNVDKPDYTDLQLFVTNGRQGVNYAANTWHHYLLALDTVCDFIVLDRGGPEKNCEEYCLGQSIIIEKL